MKASIENHLVFNNEKFYVDDFVTIKSNTKGYKKVTGRIKEFRLFNIISEKDVMIDLSAPFKSKVVCIDLEDITDIRKAEKDG